MHVKQLLVRQRIRNKNLNIITITMSKKLVVSLSPHVHSGDSIAKNMYGVLIALAPATILSVVFFGFDALRVLLTSVVACVLTEFVINKWLMKRSRLTITDGSAILTGLLLAFNVPSNLPAWIIIIGAIFTIGVGKMSFGGLGNNVFNPAIMGRVFLLLSFPVQMTTWPVEMGIDGQTAATPLSLMKEAISSGAGLDKLPSTFELFVGSFHNLGAGSLGEVSALALLVGLAFMLWRKIITWHIPVSILATVLVFTGLLYLGNPDHYASPLVQLSSGGLMLGAIFMATDYVTSPMSKQGMLLYGVGIGLLTVVIRNWGAYPEGMSFAILIMNAFVPLINTYIKPRRFGVVAKAK